MQMQFNINTGNGILPGELFLPNDALGVVLFTHGSGSSRYSLRDRFDRRTLGEQHRAHDTLNVNGDSIHRGTSDVAVEHRRSSRIV